MTAQKSDAITTSGQWEKVRLRLALAAPIDGQAIVRINIYTNHGCPVLWTEPDVTRVEPKASAVIAELGT